MIRLFFRAAFFCMFAKKIKMKLIIDCGSTKADWVLLDDKNIINKTQTEGFNPNYTDKEHISRIALNNNLYSTYLQDITHIFFYGSGCGNQQNIEFIKDILKSIFIHSEIHVYSDMIAACHAVSAHKKGIVCILGTGSNSCLFDGNEIIDKAVSLGYIIGDEGSGSHIGKSILHDYLYKMMPDDLSSKIKTEYDIDVNSFIYNAYHSNKPSQYLASFAKIAIENKDNIYIKSLCTKCFDEFIDCFIMSYDKYHEKTVSFVGSIAYYFQDIIKERLTIRNLKMGEVLKSPIDGLVKYYLDC